MPILKKIFLKSPESPWFWLLLGIVFKGIIPFIWLLHSNPICEIPGFWGGTGGDTYSYLDPIDNWIAHGVYTPDFRMPGYGLVYLIFRIFFKKLIACDMLLLLQYLLISISVYYLALTARQIFKNDRVFYVCFYLFLISNFSNFFDGFIQTECLCSSFLIFSVYLFVRYFHSKAVWHLIFSSILLTWAIFMRPGFALLLPVFALVLIFEKRSDIRKNIKYGILFIIPFLIVDSIWTIRNYSHFNKIIPLAYIGNYPNVAATYEQPMFYFAQCWGGAYSFGMKEPDMSWFDYTYPGRIKPAHYDSLPDYIYTSKYNKDSLLHLKKLIIALQNPSIDSNLANTYQRELIAKFNAYKASFKQEKPFMYYMQVPTKLIGILLYGSYTKKYLDRGQTLGMLNPLLRIYATGLYLGILGLGIIGSIVLLFVGFRQNILYTFIALIPLYTILIHAVVLRVPDNRFLMPAWSFIILCAAYVITRIYEGLFRNNG